MYFINILKSNFPSNQNFPYIPIRVCGVVTPPFPPDEPGCGPSKGLYESWDHVLFCTYTHLKYVIKIDFNS
jgi:hypothetical protein